MITFRTAQKCFGSYSPEKWDHKTGTSRAEFRLNPMLFKQAAFEVKCMELLRLMEHLRQGKLTRTNYPDRDYTLGMKEHGLQTHREGVPDKETGERITLSVIPGGKFEKLVARKAESFAFSWAIRESETPAEFIAGLHLIVDVHRLTSHLQACNPRSSVGSGQSWLQRQRTFVALAPRAAG